MSTNFNAASKASQAHGAIPLDEPFDPFSLMSLDPKEDRFPYWLSAKPRIRLQGLHGKGAILDRSSSGFIGYDCNEVMSGSTTFD